MPCWPRPPRTRLTMRSSMGNTSVSPFNLSTTCWILSPQQTCWKPAAADLQLGLATAPVLFASSEFPQLHAMITRRFNEPGDVEEAFRLVLLSQGLEQTRQLARQHCEDAIASLSSIKPSPHRAALVGLCDKV